MSEKEIKIDTAVLIPLDRLIENEWNPNCQSEITFNQLVDEINTDGFQDPLLVVPVNKDDPETKYKIIGGAHRSRAAQVLGMKKVPCFIKTDWDEKEQKLKTVRRNLISGTLDEVKFTALVNSLASEYNLAVEDLPMLMGFDDKKDFFDKYIKDEKTEEKPWVGKEEAVSKEILAVDSISDVLNNIFSNYGETVSQDFVFFAHKGKTHLMVLTNDELFAHIEKMVTEIKESGTNINDHLLGLFKVHDSLEK